MLARQSQAHHPSLRNRAGTQLGHSPHKYFNSFAVTQRYILYRYCFYGARMCVYTSCLYTMP